MIKTYLWKTPNGYKIPIMLEEVGLEYEIQPINISKGEQKTPEYLALNPNGKIPVLVDEDAEGGAITLFESGAILSYLAEKTGKLQPTDMHGKYKVQEWLMFQVAGVGPMIGQLGYFTRFAPEKIPAAITRYTDEVKRLMGVLDAQLGKGTYIAGDYSIADISTYTWVKGLPAIEDLQFDQFTNIQRWLNDMGSKQSVKTAYEKVDAACV